MNETPARSHWLSRAHVQLALSIVLSAAAQLLLKRGTAAADDAVFAFAALRSGWVWLGIVATIVSLLSWLYALRFVPLSVAFNLSGAIHALVPLGCWVWLGESVSAKRWLGIALVMAGVLVSARPAAAVEEKL
jgi:drug/metabolite transporter (DMT)-like permease